MTYKYLKKGTPQKSYSGINVFHTLQEDGKTARCGTAVAGEFDYIIVDREMKALTSLTCMNCLTNRIRTR